MAIYDESPEQPADFGSRIPGRDPEQGEGLEQRGGTTIQNGRTSPALVFNPYYTGRPRTPTSGNKSASLNRQELIRRIKSRDSRPASPEVERSPSSDGRKRRSPAPLTTSGLVTDQQRPEAIERKERSEDTQAVGLGIERPRSALHRGDFREKESSAPTFPSHVDGQADDHVATLSTSPVAPWHPDFPAAVFRQARLERQLPASPPGLPFHRAVRSRATSVANSFVYKPPTSPLAHASRPDTPDATSRQRSRSPDKSRRHTFSPQALEHYRSDLGYQSYRTRPPPSLRAERTFPYQAHQPRRSIHGFSGLPHAPLRSAASRRPSLSDSPLHHAPLVGSYEESILRGRMSTTPSKPLNFVAQIGVLGKGNCKPTLKCPPHASIPFPAVFYSYAAGPSTTNDQPSPYVGLVDLENNLPSADSGSDKRRQRLQTSLTVDAGRLDPCVRDESSASDAHVKQRRRQKQKRRNGSPKSPPGGSYRIPQQGQLQIIIKNPNKTAVKLFLVPYDLSDMEPGQKTFIRQRSYSAGPIIDMPLQSRKNFGTDRPEASLNASDDPNERPTLRYLVHLHICCPAKGRYYLYKSIRLVFANRVPDGKEKLRNEIQMPDPRYSAYRANRDSTIGAAAAGNPNDEVRRRSHIDHASPSTDVPHPAFLAHSLPAAEYNRSVTNYNISTAPLPLHSYNRPAKDDSRPASRQLSDVMMDLDSEDYPSQDTHSSRSAFSSPHSRKSGGDMFVPLAGNRTLDDPFNFERDHSRERQPGGRNESLLSQRLKDLAFQSQNREKGNEFE